MDYSEEIKNLNKKIQFINKQIDIMEELIDNLSERLKETESSIDISDKVLLSLERKIYKALPLIYYQKEIR